MALINCPECGHEVSEMANTCPNCGMPLNNEEPQQEHNSAHKVKLIIAVAAVVLLAIAMVITCPDRNAHEEKIDAVCQEVANVAASKQSDNFASGMISFFGGRIMSAIVENYIEVDNYGVVSIGRLNNPIKNEQHIVTLGIFNQVIVLASSEEIYWTLEKQLE